MSVSRRDLLLGTAGLAAGAGLAGTMPAISQIANIEKGATLRVLRPTKFLDPDQAIFDENTAAFTKLTGVPVRVDYASWEDLRPQTAVTANTGAGPDIVVGWSDDPHIFGITLTTDAQDGEPTPLPGIYLVRGALHPNTEGVDFFASTIIAAIEADRARPALADTGGPDLLLPLGALAAALLAAGVALARRSRRAEG